MEALTQLREGYETALDLGRPVWELALQLPSLHALGVADAALRWLVGKGYAEHRLEIASTDLARSFLPPNTLRFSPESCFMLTETGIALARAILGRALASPRSASAEKMPRWDGATRELSARGRLIKRFRRPAPMLEIVLAAFEEMAWPAHLDDPLPPVRGIVPEQRLRDTVRRLNHCQEPHEIHFESDGTGAGIRWTWQS